MKEDPGVEELITFVNEVNNFLGYVIDARTFNFLWEDQHNLKMMAIETYHTNISRGINELLRRIPKISEDKIRQHGLVGLPAKFKYNVVTTIERKKTNNETKSV